MIPRSTALLNQATVLAGSCPLTHQKFRIEEKPKTASRWARLALSAQAMSRDLWAFDFDGVVCNSVGESSKSAWKASARKWPELFSKPDVQAREAEVEQKMHTVRPVVETGYENLVQVRCLLEGMSEADILHNWPTILPDSMQRWHLDRQELVELFGSTRDAWMADDLEGWLAANEIYEGVPAIVKHLMSAGAFYIVTTKQARFTEALMHNMAGVPIASEDIFSTTVSGQPKSEILIDLQREHLGMDKYHFVEDKLSTLEKVCKVDALSSWQLYLVDWGYNTEEERQRAASNPRISVVSLQELQQAAGSSA